MPKIQGVKINKKFRYFCFACTDRVTYAPEPYRFDYMVCPTCQKVHDSSNYRDENWMVMSEEEIAEINR